MIYSSFICNIISQLTFNHIHFFILSKCNYSWLLFNCHGFLELHQVRPHLPKQAFVVLGTHFDIRCPSGHPTNTKWQSILNQWKKNKFIKCYTSKANGTL